MLLPHADPLHKVTIIPRGMALGLTQQLPIDEKHNYSRDYLMDQIAILLGGRIAEEMTIGQSPPAPATTSSAPPTWPAAWSASGA